MVMDNAIWLLLGLFVGQVVGFILGRSGAKDAKRLHARETLRPVYDVHWRKFLRLQRACQLSGVHGLAVERKSRNNAGRAIIVAVGRRGCKTVACLIHPGLS